MKGLYTTRWSDGKLMHHDGAGWSVIGSYEVPGFTNLTHRNNSNQYNNAHGVFVYRGKLYARYLGGNSSTSNPRIVIAEFDGTDLDTVVDFDITGDQNERVAWSNVIEYKGRCYWFDQLVKGPNESYLNLNTFYVDELDDYIFTRELSNLGVLPNEASIREQDGFSHGAAPLLKTFKDRIMICPPHMPIGSSTNWKAWWAYNGSIDIDESGNITSQLFLTPTSNQRFVKFRIDSNTAAMTDNCPNMDKGWVTICQWKEYVYGITISGQFYRVDPSTGHKVLISDFAAHPSYSVDEEATFTTNATHADHSLSWTASNNTTAWYVWSSGGTLKFKIMNFNGVSGSTKWAYLWEESDTGRYLRLYDETGTYIPQQPSGTQFKAYWTWQGAANGDVRYPLQSTHSFVWNDNLYIFKMQSRRIEQTGTLSPVSPTKNPPTVLIRYNGNDEPETFTFTQGGSAFQITGCSFELEESSGILHVFGQDPLVNVVRHYKVDLNGVPSMEDAGTVFTKSDDFNYVKRTGLVPDLFVAFDVGDVTAVIDSRDVDVDDKTITIEYRLWGVNDDTATIAVEYQTGETESGWQTATLKTGEGDPVTGRLSSATGEAHTFVHDLDVDFDGDFVGTIQHRIRIVSQTRN